jgi:hypothetical protein
MRCSVILKKMGWEREFRIIGSKRVRVWAKIGTDEVTDQPQNLKTPLKMEVDHEVDLLAVSDFDRPDQPDHPVSKTLLIPEQTVYPTSEPTSEPSANSITNSIANSIINSISDPSAELRNEAMAVEDLESLGQKVDQVDRVDRNFTEQSLDSDQPPEIEVDHSKSEVDQQTQQQLAEVELLEYIRTVLREGDPNLARNIQTVLTEVCDKGVADRKKVWASLSENERAALMALLTAPESESETTAEPTSLTPEPTTPEPATPEPITSEPAKPELIAPEPLTQEFITPESITLEAASTPLEPSVSVESTSNSVPAPSQINSQDADKLRNIALIWWPEYYPDQLQSLVSQMYGWDAPGTKYDVAVIAEWLEGQDELIRDRINHLISLKNNI